MRDEGVDIKYFAISVCGEFIRQNTGFLLEHFLEIFQYFKVESRGY